MTFGPSSEWKTVEIDESDVGDLRIIRRADVDQVDGSYEGGPRAARRAEGDQGARLRFASG
jgi:hypothetical protein